MTYKGLIKKSHTLDYAALLTAVGFLEANSHVIQQYAGEYFGLIMLGLGVLTALLRAKTTGPVGQK